MSIMQVDRTRLSLAAAISMILTASQVSAQEATSQQGDRQRTQLEEVVVTGSLIRGTPEDAALPVKVYSSVELQEQGDPSPLEFVKNLPIQGPTTGESYYFSGSALTNNVQFNLRGLGVDKTLTLFNGRRAFQNAVVYPSGAIDRIEILKDGAAVTYGADATGGVVNIITKDRFDGVEASGSYKTYKGSDEGEWKVGLTAGLNTELANFIFAVEWDHRSELDTSERRFSSLPYWVNPAPSSNLTNLAGWIPRAAPPATIDPTDHTAAGEFGQSLLTPLPAVGLPEGLPVADFTKDQCEAVGGIYENSFRCHYVYIPYYNLVEENDVYRVFAQMKTKISDSADFTLRALWARNYSPHQYGSPSQPVIRGPARATGATNQLYVPLTNPHAQAFLERLQARGPLSFDPTNLAGFTAFTYRAFAHGGNDVFASGDNHSTPNENETKYWHITAGVTGDISDSVHYDVGLTFNQFKSVNSQPDILGYRLQEALNGFGGPNCNAVDMDPTRPGTQAVAPGEVDTGVRPAGCLWFNPFATNFPRQPTWNLANPQYVAGAENPAELVAWLFNKREAEDNMWNFTFDAVFSGELPVALPGGNIAWGVGAQYRTTKLRETVNDPLYNGQTPCDWPGQNPAPTTLPDGSPNPEFTGCTLDMAGPYLFFANNFPDAAQQQQQSYFVEIGFPILDNLNVTAAGRYEKFEPIGLDTTVYKVSAKWQIVDQFALRGSYGTNYQAPGPDIIPGELTNTVASYTRAGGAWLGSQQFTRSDIEPETATVWGIGAIAQFDWGVDQDLQIIVDYYDIETEDELGLVASTNDIANSIFSATAPNLADCSHPLIHRVTFNGGACVQGVTTARDFASIRTDFGNGPGQHVTGIDFQVNYGIGIGPGRLNVGLNASKVLTNETTATILDGFEVKPADDRLGYLNFATVGFAAPEWRGNFYVNYGFGEHNIRVQFNYVSGVDDERYLNPDGTLNVNAAGLRPAGFMPGTTQTFDISTYGVFGDDWKTVDVHYLWRASWATIGLSILNVSDEDPPASRQEFGFDPRIGNALGRQIELTLRKKF
jgi:iron complex outermembrane receptor protein